MKYAWYVIEAVITAGGVLAAYHYAREHITPGVTYIGSSIIALCRLVSAVPSFQVGG